MKLTLDLLRSKETTKQSREPQKPQHIDQQWRSEQTWSYPQFLLCAYSKFIAVKSVLNSENISQSYERGGFCMQSFSTLLKLKAVAGSPSVTKLTQSKCTGDKASGVPSAAVKKMQQTSPMTIYTLRISVKQSHRLNYRCWKKSGSEWTA